MCASARERRRGSGAGTVLGAERAMCSWSEVSTSEVFNATVTFSSSLKISRYLLSIPSKGGLYDLRARILCQTLHDQAPTARRLFTPKHPSTLPKSQWLSYTRLFSIVQPYAPARVWRQGRGNLKQLVTEWCQHHPAYAGLAKSAWCIRLKDDDQPQPQAGQKHSTVSKFCLEYTP